MISVSSNSSIGKKRGISLLSSKNERSDQKLQDKQNKRTEIQILTPLKNQELCKTNLQKVIKFNTQHVKISKTLINESEKLQQPLTDRYVNHKITKTESKEIGQIDKYIRIIKQKDKIITQLQSQRQNIKNGRNIEIQLKSIQQRNQFLQNENKSLVKKIEKLIRESSQHNSDKSILTKLHQNKLVISHYRKNDQYEQLDKTNPFNIMQEKLNKILSEIKD